MGLRYVLHADDLPGHPDIVFRRARVAVFCDGDFWHGRAWARRRVKLSRGANAEYWVAKIASNMRRDRRIRRSLRAMGWTVLRIWERDILSSPVVAARRVKSRLDQALAGRAAGATERSPRR